jgi:hypothetical protein
MPQQLKDLPERPDDVLYLWQWWREMFTGEKLTYSEIKAYSDISRRNIQASEAAVIRRLDAIYWGSLNG